MARDVFEKELMIMPDRLVELFPAFHEHNVPRVKTNNVEYDLGAV